jgi:redox-sensitive bicupin YhaK (pirin superfamily)
MAEYIVHSSYSRGQADLGWLKARYSFSFASWYHPERMRFGMLRVLNDDVIAPGKGFGMHAHDNMEIITLVLSGSLQHRDSMGHEAVIHAGDVQVMSAGTGVMHSEINPSHTEPVNLLQLWIFPKIRNVNPRYDQKSFRTEKMLNRLQELVGPGPYEKRLWIYQDAFIHYGQFEKGIESEYILHMPGNGIYVMAINGTWDLDGHQLNVRDALGIYLTDRVTFRALTSEAEILLIEVPMHGRAQAS